MSNFYVLIGAPGTGKTSVFNCLRDRGFDGATEAARHVLEEQLAIDGSALPSRDPLLFIQSMENKNIGDFERALSLKGPVFFDRGMPDLIHYAIRFNVDTTPFEASSRKYRYNKSVFVLSPWREIFENDQVRPMPFEKTIEIQDLIVKAYQDMGYNLVHVPNGSVEQRADFILDKIGGRQT